jgi:putative queuosine salvage protein
MRDVEPLTKRDMLSQLAKITQNPRHVRIDAERLEAVARRVPASVSTRWFDTFQAAEEHYKQPLPIELGDHDLLHYALIEDSQGFLAWQRQPDGKVIPLTMLIEGVKHVGAGCLTACHVRAIRKRWNTLTPDVIAEFTMREVEDYYRDEATGKVTVQLLEERLTNFREVGRVLNDQFGGLFLNVLRQADGFLYRTDGRGLVQLLHSKFPKSFGDWPIAKLPNVLALRLSNLRVIHHFAPEIDRLLQFKDFENIELGADYYRPLFFIRVGIFDISDDLKRKLIHRELIEAGSEMEREFRAFTVQAGRNLAKYLGSWSESFSSIADETHAQPFLRCRRCRVGISDEELPCPYRPVCKATNEDHELMDSGWPLVLTSEY